jgi:maltodextrin utilization protein YvdJ
MKTAILILMISFIFFSALYLIPALENIKENADTQTYQIESLLDGITVKPTDKE